MHAPKRLEKTLNFDTSLDQGETWSQSTDLDVLSTSQFSTKPTSIQGKVVHSKKENASPDMDVKREGRFRVSSQRL